MLVPISRRLNEAQKHYAKIEILNVLKKARTHPSPQPLQHVINQPAQFRGPKITSSPLYHQTYTQPQTPCQYKCSPQSLSMDTTYSIQSPSPTMPPPSPSHSHQLQFSKHRLYIQRCRKIRYKLSTNRF